MQNSRDEPSLRPSCNALPLDTWLDEMAKLAGYDNRDALVADTGVCCWMDYYSDDYSPADAWAEECSYD